MHHGRGHHADSGMTMLVVVPNKERVAESAGVLKGAETIRKLGAVFHGAELAFGIRIVVGSVGPAVGLGDAEIGQHGIIVLPSPCGCGSRRNPAAPPPAGYRSASRRAIPPGSSDPRTWSREDEQGTAATEYLGGTLLCFIGQKGEVESILLLRGDQQEWKSPSKDAVAGVLNE
jgi:hypothetical protein